MVGRLMNVPYRPVFSVGHVFPFLLFLLVPKELRDALHIGRRLSCQGGDGAEHYERILQDDIWTLV